MFEHFVISDEFIKGIYRQKERPRICFSDQIKERVKISSCREVMLAVNH